MTALAADPACKEHLTGPHHPESPDRFEAALGGLKGFQLARLAPRLANPDEIALCHRREYIRLVEREVVTGFHELSTGDTIISPRSWDAALRATGGALNAVDAVAGHQAQNAFCIVRPPGHHANAIAGMGFCLFNTIAIAARYAQKKHGIGRVLIADWDVLASAASRMARVFMVAGVTAGACGSRFIACCGKSTFRRSKRSWPAR
jgi:acetoin utilization deacetylase AcuC-like enzyme